MSKHWLVDVGGNGGGGGLLRSWAWEYFDYHFRAAGEFRDAMIATARAEGPLLFSPFVHSTLELAVIVLDDQSVLVRRLLLLLLLLLCNFVVRVVCVLPASSSRCVPTISIYNDTHRMLFARYDD